MQRACGDSLVIVTPETLGNYLSSDALHENYRKLPEIAVRVDCIRAALLATHGGFWWDADTIGLRDPQTLLHFHPNVECLYATWNRPPRRVLNGYIYFKPKSNLASRWLKTINEYLDDDLESIIWGSLGEGILTPLVVGNSSCEEVSLYTFLPIDIDSNVKAFFEPGDFNEHIHNVTVCYGLNHSWFNYWKKSAITAPESTWAASSLLIHQLLHYANS
jgi:hypothetical protein